MKAFRLYRMFIIISMAIKFFLQIYLVQKRWSAGNLQDAQTTFENLLTKQALEFKRTALKLEGLLIKVGQFMSARADVMPAVFTQPLKDLVDRVPPAPWPAIKKILTQEWNVPIEQVFEHITPNAAASASIADVYQAQLKDGRVVAVKVRRPGIEKLIAADFAALRVVIRLMKRFTNWGKWLDLDRFLQDFIETTTRELDFRQELKHARQFGQMLENYKLPIQTPNYYELWSTERVLVMDWIEGKGIHDASWLNTHNINKQKLISELIDLFFVQVFEEGFFHADPHPGNLLISNDGKLYIIDFGMMGTIRADTKKDFKLFIQGFISQDPIKMAAAFEGLGFLRTGAQSLDLQELIKTGMAFFLNKDFSRVDEQNMVEMLQFLREYIARNPLQLPAEFAFLGRAISIISGVLAQLEPQLDYLEAVKPAVEKWLTSPSTDTESEEDDDALIARIQSLAKQSWTFASARIIPWFLEIEKIPAQWNHYLHTKTSETLVARKQWQATIVFVSLMFCTTTMLAVERDLFALLFSIGTIYSGWHLYRTKLTMKEREQHE
jgi:predicted unusual protein kinase regulating ubiquinone biosynthesis (AarF/ABC1/UbiB family)